MKKRFINFRRKNNFSRILIKAFLVLATYILIVRLLQFPYINIIGALFTDVQYTISIIFILILFPFKRRFYLTIALILIVFCYPMYLFGRSSVYETLGVVSFILLCVYITLSLKDL